jgi:uncharacterized protein (DUF58 family)
MRLTRTGLGVLAASVLLGAVGLRWQYVELVVVAGLGIVAVATASLVVRRPTGLQIVGRSMPRRIGRGSAVPCRIRVVNRSRLSLPPVVLVDTLLDQVAEILVTGLGPGAEHRLDYELWARRRGVHPVGPLSARRQDLLGLVSFVQVLGEVTELVVHPKVYDLSNSRGSDQVSDIESRLRRVTADPLAGFQSLREYQRGDDTRIIHWASTARTGRLMVREYVDARRPRLTVVLDTAVTSHTEDGFEEAVDVTASLCAHARGTGLDVVLRTTDHRQRGHGDAVRDDGEMLELLARVVPTVGDETLPFTPLITIDGSSDSLVIVTGPHGGVPALPALASSLTTVRIGATDGYSAVGVIAAPDATGFQRAWLLG